MSVLRIIRSRAKTREQADLTGDSFELAEQSKPNRSVLDRMLRGLVLAPL